MKQILEYTVGHVGRPVNTRGYRKIGVVRPWNEQRREAKAWIEKNPRGRVLIIGNKNFPGLAYLMGRKEA